MQREWNEKLYVCAKTVLRNKKSWHAVLKKAFIIGKTEKKYPQRGPWPLDLRSVSRAWAGRRVRMRRRRLRPPASALSPQIPCVLLPDVNQ